MVKRTALVTGGSRGIGAAIVRALARTHRVAFTYRTWGPHVEALARETGASVYLYEAGAEWPLIAALDDAGCKPDVLVLNAGIAQRKPFADITGRDVLQLLRVNLMAPFALAQRLVPPMAERGWGRVIAIGSTGGVDGGVEQVHYACSKAGLHCLALSLSRLYSAQGVASNAIAPGPVRTDMTPDGTIAPETVADLVASLTTDDAAYITGRVIEVRA